MFDLLFNILGDKLHYAVDVIVEPGDDALGRNPKVQREWIPFDAAVGKPIIPSETNAPLARQLSNAEQIHTTQLLDLDQPVKYMDREYVVMNHHGSKHVGGEMLHCYIIRARVPGDSDVR